MSDNKNTNVPKKENFGALSAILDAAESAGLSLEQFENITYASLHAFVDHEIELLDNKAAAAQKRAAEKKATGDETRAKVLSVVTNDVQSIDEITAAVGDPDITRNMVVSRLSQLAKNGDIVKEDIQISTSEGKARKASGYRLA